MRQTTVQTQSGYYGRGYYPPPPPGYYYNNNWDNGEVAAVAIGAAAVGAMAGSAASKSSSSTPSSTVVYTNPPPGSAGLPCNPNTVVANGVTYYQCGSNWYNQAYGSGGAIYVPVPPPPGY